MKIYQKTILLKIAMVAYILNGLYGCKKYLDEKPDQKLATIETIADMQALLDYYIKINFTDPGVSNTCTDDYYITNEVFNARSEQDRNLYLWKTADNFGAGAAQWAAPYEIVYICNSILDAIDSKKEQLGSKAARQYIAAQARFNRAKAFLSILSIWTKPYNPGTASQDLGIPLRLNSNFNEQTTRATLAESYSQVITDFKSSVADLKIKDVSVFRASKAAAYGFLSRTYLQMRNYQQAKLYADSALSIEKNLMDYNTLNASATFPVAQQNVEVIFDSRAVATATATQARALINPEFYSLYTTNDLRKTIFFRASGSAFIFKGYYAGGPSVFNGIATDELLLNRAECLTRANQLTEALSDLNTLLVNRYKKGTFVPYQNLDQGALLSLVKVERRKELAFRTLRWGDIKRWNMEGDGIMLSRMVNSEKTILEPNSLRYALPIPEDIIKMTGIAQNP